MSVEEKKELRLENVLSLRKKMLQEEMNKEIMLIKKFLEEKGAKKNGSFINATYAVEKQNNKHLIDVELLVPIDREVEMPEQYKFKKVFHLKNAVYARHVGNVFKIQDTYNKMLEYITKNGFQQITVAYNVQVNEVRNMDEMIIDVYIGVNPSIL